MVTEQATETMMTEQRRQWDSGCARAFCIVGPHGRTKKREISWLGRVAMMMMLIINDDRYSSLPLTVTQPEFLFFLNLPASERIGGQRVEAFAHV